MKTATVLYIVLIGLKGSLSIPRNGSIGSCLYESNSTDYAKDIVTFQCYDSERPNAIFKQPIFLECSNKRKMFGYTVGTIRFQNCQMSRIKYNISRIFTGFHTLNISSIELQYLPAIFFAGAKKLTTLIASNNRLLEISSKQFALCPGLTDVDYSFNKINHIEEDGLGGAGTIKKLNLSHNHITTIPANVFANLPNLTTVDLSFNGIQKLLPIMFGDSSTDSSITGQWNLQYLLLSHNDLTFVDMATFAKQTQLSVLDLSYNFIKRIDFGALRFPHIEQFDINDNQLLDLDGFKNSLFQSLHAFAITGNRFNCSYLRRFLDSFEYHSSLSVLHLTSSGMYDDEEHVHGVDCYNVQSTQEPSTLSTENWTEVTTDVTTIDNTPTGNGIRTDTTTIPTTPYKIDITTTKTTINPMETMTNNVTDTTVAHAIKNVLIVLCVLIALNVAVVIIKVVRSRKAVSIPMATKYRCAYTRGVSQIYPAGTENQYETVRSLL